MVGLLEVTAAAEELDVGIRITAALGDGNDVVELQIVGSPAFGALSSEFLPRTLADISRNTSRLDLPRFSHKCLICHRHDGTKDCVRKRGFGREQVLCRGLSLNLCLDPSESTSVSNDSSIIV